MDCFWNIVPFLALPVEAGRPSALLIVAPVMRLFLPNSANPRIQGYPRDTPKLLLNLMYVVSLFEWPATTTVDRVIVILATHRCLDDLRTNLAHCTQSYRQEERYRRRDSSTVMIRPTEVRYLLMKSGTSPLSTTFISKSLLQIRR